MMFRSVLIANRGEIAVRIIAGCQQLGIRAIAVYSDADRDAMHVRAADDAYPIGPAPARESYLNIEAILDAAHAAGAEAIHPGYGFLSENAEFAVACEAAGFVFVGPPAEAIRLMGSKTAAKRAVEAAGVPTVPGYAGERADARTLAREAARIGYPVMLKAVAGGGGKGMRVVRELGELTEALGAAQREALAAFGDDSVFLEKLIVAPRHVEFQILADRYGNTIHLGERECSIQRRHQKIVEESPCTVLTPELRARMGEAAVRAAKAAGYVNAGTCEFLLGDDGSFYFLEMNTRLQVEHPVTELVTGRDLVRWQLEIAAGARLSLAQEDITPRGHAIELRLYAEDPANGFLPSTGRVLTFSVPRAPGVRVDAGIASGDEVSVHYDPMLAKLIAYGEDRTAALRRALWLLERTCVLGIETNAALLHAIVAEPDFLAGDTSTVYLETHEFAAAVEHRAPPPEVLAAAALWEAGDTQPAPDERPQPHSLTAYGRGTTHDRYNPWTSRTAVSNASERRFRYRTGDGERIVMLTPHTSAGGYLVTIDGQPFPHGPRSPAAKETHTLGPRHPAEGACVMVHTRAGGEVTLALDDRRLTVHVARREDELLVGWGGESYTLRKPRALDVDATAHAGHGESGHQSLVAPMAGTIIKVNVAEGDEVAARQTLIVLGAMKMEHAIAAPYASRVVRVPHTAGDVVAGGELLVELSANGS